MAATVHEVVEAIEEVFSTYAKRRAEEFSGHKALDDAELRELRGKATACKELWVVLRNTLGYTSG